MTDRELLIELLAITVHEHHCYSQGLRPWQLLAWTQLNPEDRQACRDLVIKAEKPEDIYQEEEEADDGEDA